MAVLIEQQDGGLDEAFSLMALKDGQGSRGSECSLVEAPPVPSPRPPLRSSASSARIWQL
jgi:hypothetical protein